MDDEDTFHDVLKINRNIKINKRFNSFIAYYINIIFSASPVTSKGKDIRYHCGATLVIMLLKLQLIMILYERIFYSLKQFCEIALINFECPIHNH